MLQIDLFEPVLIRICETAAAVDLREVYVDSADKSGNAFGESRSLFCQDVPRWAGVIRKRSTDPSKPGRGVGKGLGF